MSKTPLLALWRRKPAHVLRRHPELVEDLKAFLLQRTAVASDEERRLVEAALNDQAGYALIALARNAIDPRSDYAMSLVLVAALLHLEVAAVILVQDLIGRARKLYAETRAYESPSGSNRKAGQAFRFASRRLLSLALSWGSQISTSFFYEPDVWQKELQPLAQTPPPPEELSGGSTGPKRKQLPEGQPWLTVVRAIGDPGSADGETVARLYHRLTEPLPLEGGDVDPESIAAVLALEFPHLESAIAAVVQDLRLRRQAGAPSAYIRPLLLVGPPGIGKTRFARSLARLLRLGYGEISAAGMSDDRMLRGTARGYRGTQPALPLVLMLQSESANPVIVVDEIEKSGGSSNNGDMRHTLLSLLERETAAFWFDECLLAPCDLSHVIWVCTANDIIGLSTPLLNRLHVIPCPRPKPEMFDSLFESVLREITHGLGIERVLLPEFDNAVVEKLRQAFTRRGDVRALKRLVETALGAAARNPRDTH